MSLPPETFKTLVRAAAEKVIASAPELTALDQAIGDGDHGLNMKRGFEAVRATLPGLADKALPEMLKDTKKFSGFRSVRIMRHKTDANQVIFIEEWSTEEDYMKYIAWRTQTGAMDALVSALVSPPKMEVWPTLIAS